MIQNNNLLGHEKNSLVSLGEGLSTSSERTERGRNLSNQEQSEAFRGLTVRDFRKIAPNGFGDPYNAYPHSMDWFNDCLYVGTTRANLANRAKQIAATAPHRLGTMWPVKVPKNYFDNDLRAQIWRYHPVNQEWEKVYVSPVDRGIDGYDVPICVGFRCMTSFQGPNDPSPALFVPTWASHQTPAAYMLRSVDGVNFEIVSEPGLGLPDPKPRGLRGLVSFKGRLFTSPVVGQGRHEPNIAGSMVVYVSSDPSRGDWRLALEPKFDNNLSIFHMTPFNGQLYAGTLNINEGFQIWKTDADGEPPYKWKQVLARGAYRGKLNQIAMTLIPFKGHLYVGSAIQNGSFDFTNKVGPAPPEVIRINPDDSWDLIVGEPRITPDGLKVPLSGLGPGFGNPFSGYIWSMCVHDGWLYVGTAVWAVFLKYAGREDRWPKWLRSFLTAENVERLTQRFGGCDLWRTRDGSHWMPVTQNGFDNCFNIGFRNMVSSPYGLFVGAANPFAPEVAVKRVAGWSYETNPNGGLEIWLGSQDHPRPVVCSDSLGRVSVHPGKSQLIEKKTKNSCEKLTKEIISEFYGGSDFRHFGFWRGDIKNPRSASENLMDEILAFIPERKGTIVDIDCGLGATTRHLLKYFPSNSIIGLTNKRKYLEACQRKAPGVKFLYRKFPRFKLPPSSFDYLLWVKSIRCSIPRGLMLRESFSILKSGGRLVCFDTLYPIGIKRWAWNSLWDAEAPIRTLDEYREFFAAVGFQEIHLADVTMKCVEPFQTHLVRYLGLKKLSGEIESVTVKKVEEELLGRKPLGCRCLLISGYKP